MRGDLANHQLFLLKSVLPHHSNQSVSQSVPSSPIPRPPFTHQPHQRPLYFTKYFAFWLLICLFYTFIEPCLIISPSSFPHSSPSFLSRAQANLGPILPPAFFYRFNITFLHFHLSPPFTLITETSNFISITSSTLSIPPSISLITPFHILYTRLTSFLRFS